MKLEGRVALVTGAGRNIGRATALLFAQEGAAVVLNGLSNEGDLNSVAQEIEAAGGKALPVLADVSDPKAVQDMAKTAARALGPIDILVSNVGIRPHRSIDMTPDEWRKVMAVNLDATYFLCQAVIPGMLEKRKGSIVAIAGAAAFGLRRRVVATATAKAGLIGMMRALAKDYAGENIRANVVSPGNMATDRYDQDAYLAGRPSALIGSDRDAPDDGSPMGRRGKPEELAAACLFLASDDSSYTTGQVIHVAGGLYMG